MQFDRNELTLFVTDDGSYTLKHPAFPETYHSKFGAVTEAITVFLENSQVNNRLQQGLPTHVLEIGFGSGLNFLLTASCAKQHQCDLSYTAFENRLPPMSIIVELLNKNTTDCDNEIEALQRTLSHPPVIKASVNRYSTLTMINTDVRTYEMPGNTFDAIYLDAFSVSQNPQLWQSRFLKALHGTLKPGGTLATYSVNRLFKDALTAAGFDWKKLPGPAGKREVIVATAGC